MEMKQKLVATSNPSCEAPNVRRRCSHAAPICIYCRLYTPCQTHPQTIASKQRGIKYNSSGRQQRTSKIDCGRTALLQGNGFYLFTTQHCSASIPAAAWHGCIWRRIFTGGAIVPQLNVYQARLVRPPSFGLYHGKNLLQVLQRLAANAPMAAETNGERCVCIATWLLLRILACSAGEAERSEVLLLCPQHQGRLQTAKQPSRPTARHGRRQRAAGGCRRAAQRPRQLQPVQRSKAVPAAAGRPAWQPSRLLLHIQWTGITVRRGGQHCRSTLLRRAVGSAHVVARHRDMSPRAKMLRKRGSASCSVSMGLDEKVRGDARA